MSDADAVLSAVRAVEDGDDLEDDAPKRQPPLDSGDPEEIIDEDSASEESGVLDVDLLGWATSVPEGSHRDFDASDWWDPEGGGENRLAFHLSALAGSGGGYPNLPGAIVGAAELYYRRVVGVEASDEVSGDGPKETASRAEADELV